MSIGPRHSASPRNRGAAARLGPRLVCVSTSACLLAVLLTGCAATKAALWGSPPEGQDQIKVGTPRSAVEDILGEPVGEGGPVQTYEYSTRERPNIALSAILDVATMGMSAMYWSDFQKAYDSQRVRRSFVYGPDDRLVSLSPDAADQTFERWLKSDRRADSLELLCQAANNGHADALAVEAARYRYGLWGTDIDPIKTYASIGLAAYFGNPAAAQMSETWRRDMAPDQVAEADRQVASWQPDLASCESSETSVAEVAEQSRTHLEGLEDLARGGNVEAQYGLALAVSSPDEHLKWMCLAANHGHPEAQYTMGDYYRIGFGPLDEDPVRALLWYSLAQANGLEPKIEGGYIKTATGWECCIDRPPADIVFEGMTAAERAEAARLISDWKPDPAECEGEAAVSEN